MAATTCSMSVNMYQSPSGLLIFTYVGDVTKALADGIVVSEGTDFKGMGFVAQTLVRMDSHFETNRNKLILKEKAHFKPWTVYTTGECAEFNWVIHAIVIPRSGKQHIDEWKGKMASLYKKIFREAENKGVSILALPLLGSGHVDQMDAVEVAVRAVFSYKKTSIVKVLLVLDREGIVDMLAIQCAYLCSVKGGKALDLPQTHTNTGRKNGSTLPCPLPRPKLNGETDSNHSCRRKKVGDRSDPRRDSNNSDRMVLRSGRQLPSMPPQNKAQSSRSNTNMNGPGRTCQRKRDSELKQVNGQVDEHHFRTCDSKHDEPRSQQHTREFSGGAKPKVSKKDDNDDDDYNGDDGDNNNDDKGDGDDDGNVGCNTFRTGTHSEVYGSGFEKYANADHEDLTLPMAHLSISHAKEKVTKKKPAAQTCVICLEEISNPKTLDRCGHVFCTDCIEVWFARNKPVCPSCNMVYGVPTRNQPEGTMDGLKKPDNIDITAGDQISREYRKEHGCNQRKAIDKAAGRTKTHSKVYASGSEKYTTTNQEDLTLPMTNLSISHTKQKVTKTKPAVQTCTICLEEISNPKTLDRCGHVFCTDCIEDCFARYKPVCPSCNMVYGVPTRNQPEGTMDGLKKPDNIDITAGDQISREYRKEHGCNQRKAIDKAAGRTKTHSKVYASGSEKYTTTNQEDLTLPMTNLSISHTKQKVTKTKPAVQTCTICLEEISNPKTLDRCGHVFCTDCIEDCFARYKPVCPSCNMVYGVLTGNQPEGTMGMAFSEEHLPGYETCGMITITYHFPNGTQRADHPNPGDFYKGTTRVAYLPDCQEGRNILRLLRKAFDRKLTFTVGRSTTTGRENVVTWNDINHKTSVDGGPARFGYPDKTYLTRVKVELASKGVTESN